MKNARGFTIIELVIVIIILGLLAVTALPRFMNITERAQDASVEGVAGGFASAVGLIRAQWEVDGRPSLGTDIEIDTDGTTILVGTTGYPVSVNNSGVDESTFSSTDCLDIWAVMFQQNPPTVTTNTSVADDDDYYVLQAGGAGVNRRCVYYQIASVGLTNNTIPPEANGNNDGTYGKGFNYYPATGRVFTFSND